VEGHHWGDGVLEQAAGMQDDSITPQAHQEVNALSKTAGAEGGGQRDDTTGQQAAGGFSNRGSGRASYV
jgi:hypothetical protein